MTDTGRTGRRAMGPWAPAAVCLVVALIAIAGTALAARGFDSSDASEAATISGLRNRLSAARIASDRSTSKKTAEAAGLSSDRKAADDEAAERMLTDACTWNSLESYNRARDALKQSYHLSDDSQFLRVFMPPAETFVTADGKTANVIDSFGASLSFKGLKSYVAGVSGDVYEYCAVVTVTGRDSAGATADGPFLMTYSTSPDHKLSNLSAYALSD